MYVSTGVCMDSPAPSTSVWWEGREAMGKQYVSVLNTAQTAAAMGVGASSFAKAALHAAYVYAAMPTDRLVFLEV